MVTPIISDLLIVAITSSTHKWSAGVSVVLRANLCGFFLPRVRCVRVKGASDTARRASSASGCVSCCVAAGFALFAILQASWCFGPETVAQQI